MSLSNVSHIICHILKRIQIDIVNIALPNARLRFTTDKGVGNAVTLARNKRFGKNAPSYNRTIKQIALDFHIFCLLTCDIVACTACLISVTTLKKRLPLH